jgi:hypothetical protein
MRKRKRHIKLPLRIPQNIIDMFVEYREWRKNQAGYPENFKEEFFKRFDAVCKKWHLYTGWGACAGSFWIFTQIGIVVYTHINEKKSLTIQQCTNLYDDEYDPWKNKYPKQNKGCLSYQDYVYDWSGYKNLTVPEV